MEDDTFGLSRCLSKSSKTLGPTPSDLLDSRECLDIIVITFGLSRSLPFLSKSSKTLVPTPSVVVGFVHVRLI